MTRSDSASAWWRLSRLMAVALAVVGFVGACDLQNIAELEPGVSTEADVREKFGQPEAVWEGEDGAQVYEYNRQPAGHVNYMITVGANGILVKVEQVLTEANFARVQPGMPLEQVRRLLGKPAKVTPYDLKREIHHDWRYLAGATTEDSRLFTVVFDRDLRVLRTERSRDPELDRANR